MKTLKQEILDVENYSMSFEEIKTILTGRVPGLKLRFLYEKSHNFKNIWKQRVNVCFTLLELGELKHWIVFTKEFMYDPLGNSPEFFREKWPKFYAVVKDLDWNRHAHEKSSVNINSCGEHCVIRAVKFRMNNKQFNTWLSSIMPGRSDLLVSVMLYIGTRNYLD